MKHVFNFFKDEEGGASVEYGLLSFLIATVIIGTVFALGSRVNTMFQAVVYGFAE